MVCWVTIMFLGVLVPDHPGCPVLIFVINVAAAGEDDNAADDDDDVVNSSYIFTDVGHDTHSTRLSSAGHCYQGHY